MKTQIKYGWRDLQIGESDYRHGATLQKARDAWLTYRANHREAMAGREIVFTETASGVSYKRVK